MIGIKLINCFSSFLRSLLLVPPVKILPDKQYLPDEVIKAKAEKTTSKAKKQKAYNRKIMEK